jgi:hypothetical protein
MLRKEGLSRRAFVTRACAAVAAPYVITSTALGADGRPAASERIVMGGIGIGNMGSGDLGAFLGRNDVQYVAVSDVRKGAAETAQKRVNDRYKTSDCKIHGDFRDLLARQDIDAVHIATPDHWHGVMVVTACREGKDVYCQKPESLTIRQGREMVRAARRYGRVVSGGSQRVLDDYGKIAQPCWSGEKGTIKECFVNVGGPSIPCNLPGEPVPADVDWEMWLGPAPWAPYHPHRMSGTYSINGTGWRSWQDYSGGGMTDWGAHKFGGAMFACDVRDQGPVEILPPDGEERKYMMFRFANGLLMYHSPGKGDVDVVGTPGEQLPAKPMPRYRGEGGIYGDFIECVKTREKPFRDIEFAHRTVSVCHLGNICYELKRALKWDPENEIFPDDDEANRMLDRAKREPWQI